MSLHGMDGLQRALREAPESVNNQLSQAVASSTFAIAQRMRATVPVRTGTLRRSIGSSSTKLTGRVTIGVDAFYWPYLEYGRLGVAAAPFVRPAGEAESLEFERRILAIGRTLENTWSRAA